MICCFATGRFLVLRLALLLPLAWPGALQAGLLEYVRKPDPSFAWKLKNKLEVPGGAIIYDLELTSQTWHDITWTHQLQVYQPKGVEPNATMLVYNTGGKANPANIAMGFELAGKIRAPVAILYHIPNQPLLGGKTEDALIAETFVRALQTRDDSWPLLFPMVKSVVKSMDALQAFAQQEWKQSITGFIISGASKRGWTTWLTGAADPRVKAIVPLVIDTLNMVKQMEHQLASYGAYSEQIEDYTKRKLVPIPKTEEAKNLWKMVDPYFYRDRLTMPKLLINGNNDEYWTVDALNLYWPDLKGDKWVTYVPNAGHDLNQGGKQGRTHALNALSAFARHQATGKPMPKLHWKHDNDGKMLRLTVNSEPPPLAARLWVAQAPTRDFRQSPWVERPVQLEAGAVRGEVARPRSGYLAFYGELEFEIDGLRYPLSTQIRVVPGGNGASPAGR